MSSSNSGGGANNHHLLANNDIIGGGIHTVSPLASNNSLPPSPLITTTPISTTTTPTLLSALDLKNSDSHSEVSESGTGGGNSVWGSREDLRDFVTKHGFKDLSELYQDRFRVDRRKLEQMLIGDNEALVPADIFFSKVMDDTDTFITWPNKLKLGAKSKKDPHVRVAGTVDGVEAAKDRIMNILHTRCNRVTMKLEISYTDHSHIIGKGGNCIKRVMEETQCHVHFPDSNRLNTMEKSNQVSISGELERVEHARSRVRELIPLIFGFEPPIMSQNINSSTPYVQKIQEQYKVQVMFKTRSKLHAVIVLVKGVEWEVDQVKQATILLMDYMCEHLASQTPVQMALQISPQHHDTVLGKNHSNLKAIMQYTNCRIMFPDAHDSNIPNLKKSNINISGSIHNVYKARQLLIGSLPLLIIFDLPEDCSELRIKPEQLSEIQTGCDVTINIRQKSKQVIKACVVKGVEKYAGQLYKARNLILGIDEPPIHADIPKYYHLPVVPPPLAVPPPPSTTALSGLAASTSSSASLFTASDNTAASTNHYNPIAGAFPATPTYGNAWLLPPPPPPQYAAHTPPQPQQYGSTSGTPFIHSQFLYTNGSGRGQLITPPPHLQQRHASTNNTSYYSFGGTALSEVPLLDSISSTPPQHQVGGFTPSPTTPNANIVASDFEKRSSIIDTGTGGFSGKASYCDYEAKRLAAARAIQRGGGGGGGGGSGYRVPTSTWSGYGLSHTSPANFLSSPSTESPTHTSPQPPPPLNNSSNNVWQQIGGTTPTLSTSNLLEHMPSPYLARMRTACPSTWTDLPSFLAYLDLERYTPTFVQHEIDLNTFATLSEADLVEVGVTAFGSRRKMLYAIAELNKQRYQQQQQQQALPLLLAGGSTMATPSSNSQFSLAPGAERKRSSTTSSSTSTPPHS